MARIPLIVSGGQVTVKASIVSPGMRKGAPLILLVDTGSTSVVLSQRDAESLGVAVADLPRSSSAHLGYGGRMEAGVIRNVLVALTASDGRTVAVPLGEVIVNRAASAVRRDERHVYSIPSVLGTDVLLAGDFSLYVHMNRAEAHLDSDEGGG